MRYLTFTLFTICLILYVITSVSGLQVISLLCIFMCGGATAVEKNDYTILSEEDCYFKLYGHQHPFVLRKYADQKKMTDIYAKAMYSQLRGMTELERCENMYRLHRGLR